VETAFWFIILVGVLIFVHEAGHFLFAKLFNVKVLTFSLGFGTPIRIGKYKLSYQAEETEYRLAWFPIGGFVRMLGDDPTQEVSEEDAPRAFITQNAWKRFLIIFGGPLFSVIFAIPVNFIINVAQNTAIAPVVGRIEPGSPAYKSNIQIGDKILSIGDEKVTSWDDIDSGTQETEGKEVLLRIERDGKEISLSIQPREEFDEHGLKLLGDRWDLGIRSAPLGNIVGVVPHSPADIAGLEVFDEIKKINGVEVKGWEDISKVISENGLTPLSLSVVRNDEIKIGAVSWYAKISWEVEIQPVSKERAPAKAMITGNVYTGLEPSALYIVGTLAGKPARKHGLKPGDKIVSVMGETIYSTEQFSRAIISNADKTIALEYRHGNELRAIEFKPATISETSEFKQTTEKPGFGVSWPSEYRNLLPSKRIPRQDRFSYALKMAFVDTWTAVYVNINGFIRLFEGRVKVTEALGGPLMIADLAGKMAERGWQHFLGIMAMISVLLGIINLLPVPILDGGHILFIFIEAIRRRPVSVQAKVVASYVGLVLLMALMVFVIGNDMHRYWFK
jgi:regulator of sigma E protease